MVSREPGASRAFGGWLTLLAVVAVVTAAAAAWWTVAAARRGAVEGAALAFENEVAARARALESRLASVRSDLIFLASSAPLERVDFRGPSVETWRQAGAESAVLLFLRGHPEVVRVVANSADGSPVFHAGRRGGVPLLWVARNPTGREGAAIAPGRKRLLTRVAWKDASGESELPALEIEVEPSELFPPQEAAWSCELHDGDGSLLTSETAEQPSGAPRLRGRASIDARGWSAPSPWHLVCEQPELAALALVGPLVERYQTMLVVAPVVLALTILLALAAVLESRRRARIEARVRDEEKTRALEQQLFHAERLATVGRLAAGIAHEINNPLEGMSNWLSLARGDLARGRLDEVEAHLSRVKEGLDRAAGIVRQVLTQAEPSEAAHSTVDLHQVIRDTSGLVRSRKEFRDVAVELDLDPDPLLVRGNPVTLGQVALNLLVNACEVQPLGGEVRVSTRRERQTAVAEFADRGEGIAESDRERIFEPFFTTKSSTGLGLSISHAIVRQHRGELEILPRQGGGSVFRVSLPAAES